MMMMVMMMMILKVFYDEPRSSDRVYWVLVKVPFVFHWREVTEIRVTGEPRGAKPAREDVTWKEMQFYINLV
ncbi:hypothetical protein CRM22_010526 [Opisthorchis felineus]|uniref:Uncharacterized protein n=1 Tax=Opisthorchis felineus TaxID=147828 RepID=A0A4S2KXQ9_OPIFE|nr:hypothetical protein CRM22_010526 [Opisthorchis felineus]